MKTIEKENLIWCGRYLDHNGIRYFDYSASGFCFVMKGKRAGACKYNFFHLFGLLSPGDEGAQIGGMCIENAGGVRAVKHGIMRRCRMLMWSAGRHLSTIMR